MKKIKIADVFFGKTRVASEKTRTTTVENTGTERISSLVTNSNSVFGSNSLVEVDTNFPANANIFYWDNAKTIQNANGEFATTNQGYGKAGTTNANRKFIPHFVDLEIRITDPVASTEFALDEAFDVVGASTGTLVVIEAQNDANAWVDITVAGNPVSVTAGTFRASCKFLETDGFSAGNPYTIRVKDGVNPDVFDTVDVATESDTQGLLILDATCLASTPETLENTVETQTLDATCSASSPTSI